MGGADPNRPCIFPFKYEDEYEWNSLNGHKDGIRRYDKCALDLNGKAWCSTNVDPRTNERRNGHFH